MSELEQLRSMTKVVADTGEIESIKAYKPQDATTNPSLLLAAAQLPAYQSLVDEAVAFADSHPGTTEEKLTVCIDKLFVIFGCEILKIIPGRVSTEVDARLSFNTQATIQKVAPLHRAVQKAGISKDRILIKIASTWEGIRAAEILEKEGIHCNMTLLFGLGQAIACAEAKATLISPFVGRILDWYLKDLGVDSIAPHDDPGVKSVTTIFNYYKKFGYKTEVIGASFRNAGEIRELAGCDLLTIAPKFLDELQKGTGTLTRKLDVTAVQQLNIERIAMNEETFRWMLNEEAMATEKLADGIRRFNADSNKLRNYVRQRLEATVKAS